MSIVTQRLQNLLEQKGTILWDSYVNMLKYLESMFLSPKHWVLEFLQNAEDASAKQISIRLGQNSLKILNDGNVFSNEDFYTICDVNSRKLPSLGFRGYIGIGFKSIFRITNLINIHSGNFHFKFDRGYWDNSKREGVKTSNWPWEILPIEIEPIELEEDYTTDFSIPIESTKGQEMLEDVEKFLSSDNFPKEAILLLEKIQIIELQTPQLSFTITKELIESEITPVGKKEHVLVRKQRQGQQYSEENLYLVFRKTVKVPDNISQDEETERVRRVDISDREIGIVFLLDSREELQNLSGTLAGVYSFLPVEGEQTGLPFGIFGDFIPNPGRDFINYTAKWNHWMCDEIVEFFKQVVLQVFLSHAVWKFFPAKIYSQVQYGPKFWKDKLIDPIKSFLDIEALYPNIDGTISKLDELIKVSDDIIEIIGKDTIEKTLSKKVIHPLIQSLLSSTIDLYDLLYRKELLETMKNQPEKLIDIYCRINELNGYRVNGRATPLSHLPFVLGIDNEFYPPTQLMTLGIDPSHLSEFLKEFVFPSEKKQLHPEIAKSDEAVNQLARCSLEVVNEFHIKQRVAELINKIRTKESCPNSWKFPDDLIQSTLFLIAEGGNLPNRLVAQNGILYEPSNLFVSGVGLDWFPLWKDNLLPEFEPVHEKYFAQKHLEQYGLQIERIYQLLEKSGVHGFNRDKDTKLIENAGYAIATKRLSEEGHNIISVTQRHKIGYDLKCDGHCEKVFEVKGMGESEDIDFPESEVFAAQQRKENYVLICVYNIPTHPDKIRYKAIPNPKRIWEPVEKATIPKNNWLEI